MRTFLIFQVFIIASTAGHAQSSGQEIPYGKQLQFDNQGNIIAKGNNK